jgi:hypothetical protein
MLAQIRKRYPMSIEAFAAVLASSLRPRILTAATMFRKETAT